MWQDEERLDDLPRSGRPRADSGESSRGVSEREAGEGFTDLEETPKNQQDVVKDVQGECNLEENARR